jgi:hypothetical protein
MSQNEIKSASFTSDTWKRYIDKVAKDKENVEDQSQLIFPLLDVLLSCSLDRVSYRLSKL